MVTNKRKKKIIRRPLRVKKDVHGYYVILRKKKVYISDLSQTYKNTIRRHLDNEAGYTSIGLTRADVPKVRALLNKKITQNLDEKDGKFTMASKNESDLEKILKSISQIRGGPSGAPQQSQYRTPSSTDDIEKRLRIEALEQDVEKEKAFGKALEKTARAGLKDENALIDNAVKLEAKEREIANLKERLSDKTEETNMERKYAEDVRDAQEKANASEMELKQLREMMATAKAEAKTNMDKKSAADVKDAQAKANASEMEIKRLQEAYATAKEEQKQAEIALQNVRKEMDTGKKNVAGIEGKYQNALKAKDLLIQENNKLIEKIKKEHKELNDALMLDNASAFESLQKDKEMLTSKTTHIENLQNQIREIQHELSQRDNKILSHEQEMEETRNQLAAMVRNNYISKEDAGRIIDEEIEKFREAANTEAAKRLKREAELQGKISLLEKEKQEAISERMSLEADLDISKEEVKKAKERGGDLSDAMFYIANEWDAYKNPITPQPLVLHDEVKAAPLISEIPMAEKHERAFKHTIDMKKERDNRAAATNTVRKQQQDERMAATRADVLGVAPIFTTNPAEMDIEAVRAPVFTKNPEEMDIEDDTVRAPVFTENPEELDMIFGTRDTVGGGKSHKLKYILDKINRIFNEHSGSGLDSSNYDKQANRNAKRKRPDFYDGDGLTNREIDQITDDIIDVDVPVIMADEIETLLPNVDKDTRQYGFIINSDPKHREGRHWRACFLDIDKGDVYYFDSLVSDPSNRFMEGLEALVNKIDPPTYLKLKTNTAKLQSDSTDTCGWFCIKFIEDMYSGVPFHKFTPTIDESSKGEKQIEKFKEKYVTWI